MDDPIITILISVGVLILFIVVFAIVDKLSKDKVKETKEVNDVKAAPAASKQEDEKKELPASSICKDSVGSQLATAIESLISKDESSNEQTVDSQRSNLASRRAQMQANYEKKYKARDASFRNFDGFEESSSLVVDGVEISNEDVKKLTALHSLFERKAGE